MQDKRLRVWWMMLCGCLLSASVAFAQEKGKAVFEEPTMNVGVVKEDSGMVTKVYWFTNMGKGPLNILKARPSCGCTTPTFSQRPVNPGERGYVRVVFNPENRPGDFHKTIVVVTDGVPSEITLHLKGKVLPREKGPKDFYPFEEGNLRFKTNHFTFGQVHPDENKVESTIIYNQGNKPIRFSVKRSQTPPHIALKLTKSGLLPGDTLTMYVMYKGTRQKDWGFQFENFLLATDDPIKPKKSIHVSADMVERFEKGAAAPRIDFDRTVFGFGTVKQGEQKEMSFTVSNKGRADLILRKVSPSCSCTQVKVGKTTLGPGESTEIRVQFDTRQRSGPQNKEITVICNDPRQPVTRLKIKAEVVE